MLIGTFLIASAWGLGIFPVWLSIIYTLIGMGIIFSYFRKIYKTAMKYEKSSKTETNENSLEDYTNEDHK